MVPCVCGTVRPVSRYPSCGGTKTRSTWWRSARTAPAWRQRRATKPSASGTRSLTGFDTRSVRKSSSPGPQRCPTPAGTSFRELKILELLRNADAKIGAVSPRRPLQCLTLRLCRSHAAWLFDKASPVSSEDYQAPSPYVSRPLFVRSLRAMRHSRPSATHSDPSPSMTAGDSSKDAATPLHKK